MRRSWLEVCVWLLVHSFIHPSIHPFIFILIILMLIIIVILEEKKDKWFVCFQKSGLFCECLCARFSLES